MSSNEDRAYGIEEARKRLGPIANRAHLAGEITYLTRNGSRIAAVVPLNRIKETAVLHTEKLAAQVTTTLGDHPEDFHIDAIVEEIGDTYGRDTVSVDVIPSDEYWAIVRKHERATVIYTRTTHEGTEAIRVIRDGEEVREITDTAQEATMARTKKPEIKQQYGIRWPTGVVFPFRSREDAEEELRNDGRGVGVLVVHEGVPGQPGWTEWIEAS